jgi:hypothetical protein
MSTTENVLEKKNDNPGVRATTKKHALHHPPSFVGVWVVVIVIVTIHRNLVVTHNISAFCESVVSCR